MASRPRTEKDKATRNRRDRKNARRSLREANKRFETIDETIEIESAAWEMKFAMALKIDRKGLPQKNCDEINQLRRDAFDDAEFDRETARRQYRPEVRVGQVWGCLNEKIRILEILTGEGGDGGHFLVLADYIGEEGYPFKIDAMRIRMDWHLEEIGAAEGQMELFS